MILLIWVLIALFSNYSCYAATINVVENVYIDTLIERYLTEEKVLWNYMYNSSDRSTKNLNFILNKISTNYDNISQDRYFEYVMSVAYMSKFIKYMDFYNVQNYVEENQNKVLSSSDGQHNSYLTFDMTFGVYNHTRMDQLFSEILEHDVDFRNTLKPPKPQNDKLFYVVPEPPEQHETHGWYHSTELNYRQCLDEAQEGGGANDMHFDLVPLSPLSAANLASHMIDTNSTCSTWSTEMESSSQKLYMFFEILSANLLTSYMKSQRANMKQVIKRGFEEHDSEILRAQFYAMYEKITTAAKESLQLASRTTWMCDRNATDDQGDSQQVTNFLRGYVDNQINLNNEKSCWGTCSDYKFAKNHGCYNGTFCDEQRKVGEADPICRGTIVDCLFIEDKMEICPSVSGRNRRYEYINYGCTPTNRVNHTRCLADGRYFGRSADCETERKTLKSFRNEWFMKCNYCFCYCDEQDVDSDRYFSLRPVVSDVRDNMVVSGVAIIKRNGIFSFSITQSQLISHGRVQQHQSDPRRSVIFSDFRRSDVDVIDGVDYHTLSWQNRSVNLDTITLPRGCVVTGVRFVVDREHIGLAIRSTKFDFNSGTLLDANEWIGTDFSDRTSIHIDRPEPNRYYDVYGAYLSVPDFRKRLYVKFRPSDPDKDAGQTTVPFIDTQWVRPKNLTPFSGIGLYYKGKPGLGGFIAPAVVVYDVIPHFGNKLSL